MWIICKRKSENSNLNSIKQEKEKLRDGWLSKKNSDENESKNEKNIENQLSSNISSIWNWKKNVNKKFFNETRNSKENFQLNDFRILFTSNTRRTLKKRWFYQNLINDSKYFNQRKKFSNQYLNCIYLNMKSNIKRRKGKS